MTALQHAALGRLPFSAEEVERMYSTEHTNLWLSFKALCESHERLRAELEGTDSLLRESEQALQRLSQTDS